MAAFGWTNRRSLASRLSHSRKVDGEASKVDDKANGDQNGKQRKLTLVEKINVVWGGKCFGVQISKESTLVDSFWLEIFFVLIPTGGPVKEEFQMEAHLNFNPVKESGCDMAEKGRVVLPFSSNAFGEANTFAVDDSILIGNRGKEKEKQEIGGGFHKRISDKDDGLKRSANSSRLNEGGERSTSEKNFQEGSSQRK
ncbi:hypothetical protein Q3G72_033957 [Acer saccharum]|nr:hypothetical protein Q3G72_033957 [Acer saccharum]